MNLQCVLGEELLDCVAAGVHEVHRNAAGRKYAREMRWQAKGAILNDLLAHQHHRKLEAPPMCAQVAAIQQATPG
eukprot:CAMPEP_0119316592 /NCGR_PEP_ID=MMETSP1333-20130426/40131_1 /TAXON_ID=418940 /ORGANISM="Scyphosphaera apsteinii, Strain RCC1455" /LENGTH=74 /DNA_ID=CAMNT_0007322275 /DNA_START=223 /DNA_END=447 /DNA_ORIENTATION=-